VTGASLATATSSAAAASPVTVASDSEPLIDLGGDWTPPEDSPRRYDMRRASRWLIVLFALLLTGAAPPAGSALRGLGALPFGIYGHFGFGEDTVVVGQQVADGLLLSAYRLPGLSLMWRAQAPLSTNQVGLSIAGPMLLGQSYEDLPQVFAIAIDSGQMKWQRRGMQQASPAMAGTVLLERPAYFDPGTPGEIQSVDLRTGLTRWSAPEPAGANYVDDRTRRVIQVDADGTMRELDALTGALLVTGRTDALASAISPAAGPSIAASVVGDALYTSSQDGVVNAYDLDTLRPRWRADLTQPGAVAVPEVQGLVYVGDCAPMLCASGTGQEMVALDPATGEVRWRRADYGWASGVHGLLVAGEDTTPGSHFVVVDASSGRTRLNLGRWTQLPSDKYASTFIAPDINHSELLWLGVLRSVPARIDPIGKVTALAVDQCWLANRYLACVRPDTKLGVWQVDSG
jgi:outer membrane protein assembly factor BamB